MIQFTGNINQYSQWVGVPVKGANSNVINWNS
jgi:hypothetical protein